MYVQLTVFILLCGAVPVIVIDEQPPKSVHGYKNNKIRLECSAHSRRGPVTYQWLRNRKGITNA